MTITPTALLSLPIITTGTESGTWGDVVDNGLTSYLDIAIAGSLSISITTADVTLTKTAGTNAATGIVSTTAQYAILNITGAKTAARNLNLPVTSKQYTINNAGTGGFLLTVRGVTPTTGVTLVDGEKAVIAWNGTDYAKITSSVITALTGTLSTANGGTGSTSTTFVNLTTNVTGTLPVANGGTGVTASTGSGNNVLSTSPTLVTPILGTPTSGTLTNATGLPLTTGVTGTLPVANGGTGATTFTANNVLLGNGTSALQVVAPGTNGNVLTSNGTTWQSTAPTAITGLTLLATISPTVAANVDFLSTFSSTYDNYLIIGSGVTFSTDDGLALRLAVAGAADTGSNYVAVPGGNNINSSVTSTYLQLPGAASVRSAGKGCNFQISILNANDTGRFKCVDYRFIWNDNGGTTSYIYNTELAAYIGANAVTGLRLYGVLGGNFAATGKVRVYGYNNT